MKITNFPPPLRLVLSVALLLTACLLPAATPVFQKSTGFAITEPVRDMAVKAAADLKTSSLLTPVVSRAKFAVKPQSLFLNDPPSADPLLPSPSPIAAMSPPLTSFDGLSETDNKNILGVRWIPSDSNGDVGPSNYVETVNTLFRVYDKSGVPLTPPMKYSTLFAPLGAPSATYDDGDPVVRYDQLADRWIISLFVISDWFNGIYPAHQVIAVSVTGDPTGRFYVYDFPMPNNNLNDYPKLGVWPDGYYVSVNQFDTNSNFVSPGVFAFERTKLLAGDSSAGSVFFDLGGFTNSPSSLLPSDLDGAPPAVGTPNVFACLTSDQVIGSKPGDADHSGALDASGPAQSSAPTNHAPYGIRLFEFVPDFVNTTNSTFTETALIQTAPFRIFDPSTGIPQRGTTNQLDPISDRLMYRLQFRHFADHESLVVNHTVQVNASGTAGVRYVELRRFLPAGVYFLQDEGTQSPDSESRWMGSAALDWKGNLAVGYSLSGNDLFPSIRYAGRLGSAPTSGLNLTEATMFDGTGAQLEINRWGDYSMLGLDPVDDSTFWYVNQYYTNFARANWNTRIGTFKLTNSAASPKGLLRISAIDGSGQPVVGAVVTIGNGYWRTTDSSGGCDFLLPPGNYTASISAAGFETAPPLGLSLTNGQKVSNQFQLKRLAHFLSLTATNEFDFTGAWQGQSSPDSFTCILINSGTQPETWAAYWNSSWLRVTPASGTLASGAAARILVRLAPAATSLSPENYTDTLVIADSSGGSTFTRPVSFIVTNSPGVISLSAATYTTNATAGTIVVEVDRLSGADGIALVDLVTQDGSAVAGIDYQATARTLVFSNGETNKTVSIPLLGNRNPPSKTFSLSLTNAGDGAVLGDTVYATVTLFAPDGVILREMLDSDPGWSTDGDWAFGMPGGNDDPFSGYTGDNVYGYNLYGDYTNNMPATFYLTTTPFDCSQYTHVVLYFWRWLGVERAMSDHADIEVSSDSTTWTTVWSNPANTSILDTAWTNVSYDISTVAAGQPAVSIRWGMGPTDGSWTFGGWNIDDVEVYGLPASGGVVTNQPGSFLLFAQYDPLKTADVLSWASQSNQVYTLEFTTDISRLFQGLATNLVATPPLNFHTNVPTASQPTRFYRVRVQ